MNFIKFPVQSTNIFPMANTTNGGQLVTEFNLKSRESVGTAESIEYVVGPSYTHSEADFAVSLLRDNSDSYFNSNAGSGSTLEISPGRAVVNGHYIESLVPIVLDLAAINHDLAAQGEALIGGDLAIGLRVMFATEETISGSILTEYTDPETGTDLYAGVQIVLLPVEEFHTPTSTFIYNDEEIDCGKVENRNYVTADLLLATFSLVNGGISNLKNNYPGKCEMFPAVRIGHVDELLSNTYVRKTGLNPKRLYAFAGKGTNPATGLDTWCDATDSLMVWDESVPQYTNVEPTVHKATFMIDERERVSLIVPHKQIDGSIYSAGYGMESSSGEPQYFKPVKIDLPVADFSMNTPGTIDSNYTKQVKHIVDRINDFYAMVGGKQKAYIPVLTDRSKLPSITENWNIGDYVLVGQDETVISDVNDNASLTPPSTFYAVVPGYVRRISECVNVMPEGAELDRIMMDNRGEYDEPWARNDWWDLSGTFYRGVVGKDYFTLQWTDFLPDGTERVQPFYYKVEATDVPSSWSDPIVLTGQLPFAEETLVGGFLNVDPAILDQGYVYLDESGHLRLLDYALLRSGQLAYQLGEDFTTPSGITVEEIQAYLDEYVNERIAFPVTPSQNTSMNKVTVTINLPDSGAGVIEIYDIDSRFDTALILNILGTGTSDITINIRNCQRVQINPSLESVAKINLYRSCMYYNSGVMSRMSEIQDMSLWYVKDSEYEDDLVVNGLTVTATTFDLENDDVPTSAFEFWSPDTPNDNHLMVGLQSLTFAPDGRITGCGVLVRNNSTSNVAMGKSIVHDEFELPQGPALFYPANRLNKPIQVTGNFISAYTSETPEGYVVQDTKFSLMTPHYDQYGNKLGAGDIAFMIDASVVEVAEPAPIDEWDPGTFHSFYGTTQF